MKTILVTGATGFLGQVLINELLQNEEYAVIAIGGRPEDMAHPLPDNPRLKLYLLEDLFVQSFPIIDTVINCAFARSNDSALLAGALDFTEKLIKRLEEIGVGSVINISSQGVYKRLPVGHLSSENSPVEPVDLYSTAKYASEKMFRVSAIPRVTNVRLASLMMSQRFLYLFVRKAVLQEQFTVTAPNQYAALLDVTDAASGLAAITALAPEKRSNTYNLGIGTQYSLLQYAESVKEIGERMGLEVVFDIKDNGVTTCAGMDIRRLTRDTGWGPSILKDKMIWNLFRALGIQ